MGDSRTLPLSIQVEFFGGCPIRTAIVSAIEMARRLGCHITFHFNGVLLGVTAVSDPKEVEEEYDRRVCEPSDDDDEGSDDTATAKVIEMGELVYKVRQDDSNLFDPLWRRVSFPRSMLIQFDTEEEFRQAVAEKAIYLWFPDGI